MKANIPDSIVVTDQYLDPNNPQVAFENIKERSDWHNKDAEERKCAFRPAMVMDGSVRPWLADMLRSAHDRTSSKDNSKLPSLS